MQHGTFRAGLLSGILVGLGVCLITFMGGLFANAIGIPTAAAASLFSQLPNMTIETSDYPEGYDLCGVARAEDTLLQMPSAEYFGSTMHVSTKTPEDGAEGLCLSVEGPDGSCASVALCIFKDGVALPPDAVEGMTLNKDDFFFGSDGAYYYRGVLCAGETTPPVFLPDETKESTGKTCEVKLVSYGIETSPDYRGDVEWVGAMNTLNENGSMLEKGKVYTATYR